jgi:hypothetical protein
MLIYLAPLECYQAVPLELTTHHTHSFRPGSMSSPSYIPVEKHELHTFPPTYSSQSHGEIPNTGASYGAIPIDTADPKQQYPWTGMPQSKPRKPSRLLSALALLKSLLLPLLAIAYLTFCYVVHYKVVPVNTGGIVNTSPENIGE